MWHLSEEQVDKYLRRTLPAADLLALDDHLGLCSDCMQRVIRTNKTPEIAIHGILFAGPEEDHLSYDQMAHFIDERLDGPEREIVEVHRKLCRPCSTEIDDLLKVRSAVAAQGSGFHSEPEMADWSKPSFWRSIISSSFLKVAIPAATVVLVAAFAWMFLKSADEPRSETVSITGSETVNGEPRETDSAMEPQPPPVTETEGSPKPLIASLVDGGGRIELEQDGRITGLSTGKHDKRVRSALTHQTVDISADVRQLRTSTGVLMGPAADGRGFKLTAPIGKVIESQRPTLSWQPLKGAESYKVEIYDERFNRVAASPTIRTVRWTTNVTLKRGRVYQWQVTAIKDDQEIKSPVRPAPEAKFKVLDAAKANEIAEARRLAGNSNLLLGILYANAGLLDDAEREFQALLKKNPGSDIARKLLTKVRSAR